MLTPTRVRLKVSASRGVQRAFSQSGRGPSRTGHLALQDAIARPEIKLLPSGLGVRLSSAALQLESADRFNCSRSPFPSPRDGRGYWIPGLLEFQLLGYGLAVSLQLQT